MYGVRSESREQVRVWEFIIKYIQNCPTHIHTHNLFRCLICFNQFTFLLVPTIYCLHFTQRLFEFVFFIYNIQINSKIYDRNYLNIVEKDIFGSKQISNSNSNDKRKKQIHSLPLIHSLSINIKSSLCICVYACEFYKNSLIS